MALPTYNPRSPRRKKSALASSPTWARWMSLFLLMCFAVQFLGGQGRGKPKKAGSIRNKDLSLASSSAASAADATTTKILSIKLASGLEMPLIGYGTCCRASAKGEAIYKSTGMYLKLGGRHIDTAMSYGNHVEIGRAVKESGIPRSEIWITSKVAPGKVKSYNECLVAVDNIMNELDTSYVDLLLIHSPKLGKETTIELWNCLIESKRLGKTKSIGVSNFNQGEMETLAKATGQMPEVNEIQQHPWSSHAWKDLAKWQKDHDIATIAYTSLGGSRFHKSGGGTSWPSVVSLLAKKYNATEAQILLKWALQNDLVVIPGSGSEGHIKENLLLNTDFDLTAQELLSIENAEVPGGWWDPKRGYQKYTEEEASLPWKKRKNG